MSSPKRCEHRGGVAHHVDLDVEDIGLGDGRGRRRFPEPFEQPGHQGAEGELIEQDLDLVAVPLPLTELTGIDVERDVADQQRHLTVEEHPVARVAQVLALLRGELVEVREDPLEVAVGGDELRRRLLADAGHARQVVARVAAERGVLGVLAGGDPGALGDAGFVVEHVVGDAATVVEHLDVRVFDELVGVAIAGDDDDVAAGGGGAGGERGDHVVGLDALDLQRGDAQRGDHFVDQRDLRHEQAGRFLAAGLVRVVEVVAERAAGRVEDHDDLVGVLVGEHLHQHRREPVDRVGDRAVRGGEVGGERVEGAVRE